MSPVGYFAACHRGVRCAASRPVDSSDSDNARWFAEEVHPHDSRLKAYLRGSFPAVRDVDDVVQESYLRLWKARAVQPVRSARAFLFTVAKNVALALLRRHRPSPIDAVGDLGALDVLDEGPGVVDAVSTAEKIRLLVSALATLPPRSRDVIMLCKLKGLTHREAAAQLGIAEKTVYEHLLRGLKRLGEQLRRQGGSDHFGS